MNLYNASTVALVVFLILASVDGLYLHLWRYRLHTREASRYEHRLHTLTAVLFAATFCALFLRETGGVLLWTGVVLVAVDALVALLDMRSEADSRADLGGLSNGEYVLHMFIMAARGVSLALAFGGRPVAAWQLDAPWILGSLPLFAETIAWGALPGVALTAVLHLWLCTSRGVRLFEPNHGT